MLLSDWLVHLVSGCHTRAHTHTHAHTCSHSLLVSGPRGLSNSQLGPPGPCSSCLPHRGARTYSQCKILHTSYYEKFKGGAKGREREGSKCFGEEQAWENRQLSDKRGWPCINSDIYASIFQLVTMLAWPCPVPITTVCPDFLLNLVSNSLP